MGPGSQGICSKQVFQPKQVFSNVPHGSNSRDVRLLRWWECKLRKEANMVALAKSAPQTLHHIHFPNESAAYRRARCRPAEISKRTTSSKRQAKTVSRRG